MELVLFSWQALLFFFSCIPAEPHAHPHLPRSRRICLPFCLRENTRRQTWWPCMISTHATGMQCSLVSCVFARACACACTCVCACVRVPVPVYACLCLCLCLCTLRRPCDISRFSSVAYKTDGVCDKIFTGRYGMQRVLARVLLLCCPNTQTPEHPNTTVPINSPRRPCVCTHENHSANVSWLGAWGLVQTNRSTSSCCVGQTVECDSCDVCV